jgi:hypothetical protein
LINLPSMHFLWATTQMKISKSPLEHSSFPPSTLPRGLGPLLSPKTFLDAYQRQVRNSHFITTAGKNAAANLYSFQNEIKGFRDARISEKLKDTSLKIDMLASSTDGETSPEEPTEDI